MARKIYLLGFALCFFCGSVELFACDLENMPVFQKELKSVESGIATHLKDFTPGVAPVGDLVCKNWSAHPSQVIWVKLYKRNIRKSVDQIAALVGVFDFRKKSMLGTVFQPNFGVNSYAKLKYLDIDTARYQVSLERRAFGLKAGYTSAQNKNLEMREILSLYLPVKEGLKMLVDGVVLQQKFGEKGKAKKGRKQCLVAYSEFKSKMAMVPKPGNELKSFRITRQNKQFSGKYKKGNCLKVGEKTSAEKFDLDPPGYQVPVKYKHQFGF